MPNWFEAGLHDGTAKRYYPPPVSAGARARSEYNIGHFLGDKHGDEIVAQYEERLGDAEREFA